jgi:hypothetical protein
MANNFNLKNYSELLNKKDLSGTEQFELLSYRALVESQITYNRREDYFSLIDEYLSKKINPDEFRASFLKTYSQDTETLFIMEKDFEQLSDFSIDSEIYENPFSNLIDLIYNNSMLAIEEGPYDGISDDEFKVSIENAFSNLKLFE